MLNLLPVKAAETGPLTESVEDILIEADMHRTGDFDSPRDVNGTVLTALGTAEAKAALQEIKAERLASARALEEAKQAEAVRAAEEAKAKAETKARAKAEAEAKAEAKAAALEASRRKRTSAPTKKAKKAAPSSAMESEIQAYLAAQKAPPAGGSAGGGGGGDAGGGASHAASSSSDLDAAEIANVSGHVTMDVELGTSTSTAAPPSAPALSEEERVLRGKLAPIFSKFDADGSGFVSADEMEAIVTQLGMSMSEEELSKLMSEAYTPQRRIERYAARTSHARRIAPAHASRARLCLRRCRCASCVLNPFPRGCS